MPEDLTLLVRKNDQPHSNMSYLKQKLTLGTNLIILNSNKKGYNTKNLYC